MFSVLQLMTPAALAIGILAPLLIFAYLRTNDRRRKIVSSLIVLKNLPKGNPIRRKFSPPLRFFIELLALLLLSFAAASPFLQEDGQRVALIIDTSMSMQAYDQAKDAGKRLEQALVKASNRLTELDSDTLVMVFTSAPKLKKISENFLQRNEAIKSLKGISASYSSDALETAINELSTSGEYDRIIAISDKAVEYSDLNSAKDQTRTNFFGLFQSDKQNNQQQSRKTLVEGLQVGQKAANVYLTNFSIAESSLASEDRKLTAGIAQAGASPVKVAIIFSQLEIGESGNVQEKIIGRDTVNILPDKTTEVFVNTAVFVNTEVSALSNIIYRVQLEIQEKSVAARVNSILEDDTAWLAASSEAQGNLLLVSPQGATDLAGLDKISGLSVKTVSPEAFTRLSENEKSKYSLLIFRQSAPAEVPRQPTLLILPPAKNSLFPIRQEVEAARVSSWSSAHPITAYLKVPLLNLDKVAVFDTPLWAESAINVEQGAVVVSGESQGVRFAALGFEVLPFEGERTPVLTVLTLNILNWLNGGRQMSSGLLTGASLTLEPGEWEITRPDTKNLKLVSTSSAVFSYDEPGVYRLRRGQLVRNVVVNSFFPEESFTTLSGTYQAPRFVQHDREFEKEEGSLWPKILLAVCILLVLELILTLLPSRLRVNA